MEFVTDQEIAEALEPFVREMIPVDGDRWAGIVAARANKGNKPRRRTERAELSSLSPPSDRAVGWLNEKFGRDGGAVPLIWRDKGMLAKGVAVSRVHLLLLMKLVEATKPATICEVGCGSGINLFALAARFPDVSFVGLEIEPDAVARMRYVSTLSRLPEVIEAFSPLPLRDRTVHRRVQVVHGTAAMLPFADGQFDLVFTRLALEKMQDVRQLALSELSRVSRKHVAMIEGFRDWNAEGVARAYMQSQGYFDAWVSDLPASGLTPTLADADIPHKLNYRAGLVLAVPSR